MPEPSKKLDTRPCPHCGGETIPHPAEPGEVRADPVLGEVVCQGGELLPDEKHLDWSPWDAAKNPHGMRDFPDGTIQFDCPHCRARLHLDRTRRVFLERTTVGAILPAIFVIVGLTLLAWLVVPAQAVSVLSLLAFFMVLGVTYTGGVLSGSTNGKPIVVAATATPGTLLHTVGSGTTGYDEPVLFVSNVTGTAATLTIEFGGTTDPDHHLVKGFSVPANSQSFPVAAGHRLNNGLVIRGFSGTASALNITGGYNRAA